MNIAYEKYLIYDFIIFKGNLHCCNLGICLINDSIIYIKFVGTIILSFNIGGKFYII